MVLSTWERYDINLGIQPQFWYSVEQSSRVDRGGTSVTKIILATMIICEHSTPLI